MVGHMNRRRVKKRKRPNENSKMKFIVILVIMIIAVTLGYLTARFVIGPLLGYNADESPIELTGKESSSKEEAKAGGDKGEAETTEKDDEKSKEEAATNSAPKDGYALQFGVFSSREAADKLVADLKAKGIDAEIIESDNTFKVISPVLNTKNEAIDELNQIKDKEVEDVFIASF